MDKLKDKAAEQLGDKCESDPAFRMVSVVWLDSVSLADGPWHPISSIGPADRCVSTGYLVKETETALTIAAHCHRRSHDEWNVAGDITIARAAVVSMIDLGA